MSKNVEKYRQKLEKLFRLCRYNKIKRINQQFHLPLSFSFSIKFTFFIREKSKYTRFLFLN